MKKLSILVLLIFSVSTAYAVPDNVRTASMCTTPTTCTSFAPAASLADLTVSWVAVTKNGQGNPLVYPIEGYEVILIHGGTAEETLFDVSHTLPPANYDPAAPKYIIPNVGQYGFKEGDTACIEFVAYNTVKSTGILQKSDRSPRLCISL